MLMDERVAKLEEEVRFLRGKLISLGIIVAEEGARNREILLDIGKETGLSDENFYKPAADDLEKFRIFLEKVKEFGKESF